jgi:hypothetical protein
MEAASTPPVSWREAEASTSLLNEGARKQDRNLLTRYVQSNLRAPNSSGAGTSQVSVGQTRVFAFDGSQGQEQFFVGRVRQLVAGVTGTGATKRYYLEVNLDDATASYFAHPYALVSKADGGAITLTVSNEEVHQTIPVVLSTARAADCADLSDESEDEEKGKAAASARKRKAAAATTTFSNLLDVVEVDWSGPDPVVRDAASIATLSALLEPARPVQIARGTVRGTSTGRPPRPPPQASLPAAAVSPSARVPQGATRSGRQTFSSRDSTFQWGK